MFSSMLGAMSGCAQILGIEDLPTNRDGGPTPPPPDAEPLDPGEFGISAMVPNRVLEGDGAAWAVPVIVTGQEFTTDTRIVLDGAGFSQREIVPVVAADGRWMAFPLSVPVLTDSRLGETEIITVTARKGAASATIQMQVFGLDELVTSQLADTTLEASDLHPLYSRIVIDEDITLTGDDPVRLVATAEIRLEAAVIADGEDANGQTPGAGGPGGCAGGASQQPGGCGLGGGGGNDRDDGAGGGGHLVGGTPGGGTPTSLGGMETGRPELVPLADEAGNGGGGSQLGAGGGGGGIVELTSQGTFVVDGNGSISADGGRGGQGTCNSSLVSGSGGGGSGGAILVRSWTAFDDQVNEPRLSVRGGPGGLMPPDNDCVEVGGAGAFGRVRVDTADLNGLPGFAESTPDPYQGPLFRNVDNAGFPISVITTQPQITLEAVGLPGTGFALDVNDSTQTFTTAADGTASVTVPLELGPNRVCTKISADTDLDISEGVQCISIVSIQ